MSQAPPSLLYGIYRAVRGKPRPQPLTVHAEAATITLDAPAMSKTVPLSERVEQVAASAPPFLISAMAAFFIWWYGRVLLGLPIFGDAANHARIARSMVHQGPWNTVSEYPPLYHIVSGIALLIAGDTGLLVVTIFSIAAVGVAVWFFAHELTGSTWIALTSALIAFVSPKTPFYAGRLYMEVPLTALIVLSMALMHRYLRRRSRRDLLLAAVCTGLTCLTKQQGLILLAAASIFLLGEAAHETLRRRTPWRVSLAAPALYLAVSFVMVIPAVYQVLHSTGRILPDTEYTVRLNDAGARLAGYDAPEHNRAMGQWETFLDSNWRQSEYIERGQQKAEARHVWPQDVLTPEGFFSTSSPYWRHVALVGERFGWLPTVALCSTLLAGLGAWFYRPRSRRFTIFFALFFVLNYATFLRSNDQWRYYVYLSYLTVFAIPFAIDFFARRHGRVVLAASAAALIAFVSIYAVIYLPERTDAASRYANTQAYVPSRGGNASVVEASHFLRANLDKDERFYAVPTTEFQYFAQRDGVFDWRIYFLEPGQLGRYFEDFELRYVVIPNSTVKSDSEWDHIVSVPRSFQIKIAAMYTLAYRSDAGDISVYRVVPVSELDTDALAGLDFIEPSAAIARPAVGSVLAGTVSVDAMADDDRAVTNLLFYIDGRFTYGIAEHRDVYTWNWDSTTVENGEHHIWVKAVDAAGNFTTTHIPVTVDN